MQKGFLLLLLTGAFLIAITFALVRYAQGYRLVFDKNIFQNGNVSVAPTGLLAATSTPDGASVYIDNHLNSATNTTIDLSPGEYTVKIVKEGYLPWEKKLKIQKEVVTQTQALLFPTAPRLESLTTTGALGPTIDPTGSHIAFGIASASAARRNGVFILDMGTKPILTLRSASLQIADDNIDALSRGRYLWSPDARELLVVASRSAQRITTYRLRATEFNTAPADITATLSFVTTQWQTEREEREKARLDSFKPRLSDFISSHFNVISWSNDDTKVLFEASQSGAIPVFIDPPLIGSNTQQEEREIQKDRWYVYDTKEDKNFFLKNAHHDGPPPIWLPDSRHLVFIEDQQIKIIEYDATNKTVVYSGPFEGNFAYPWPDGSRLVILTSLNSQGRVGPNLYTINLK